MLDKSELAGVRRKCATCQDCDLNALEDVFRVLSMAHGISDINVLPIRNVSRTGRPIYQVVVCTNVELSFSWSGSHAQDLFLIC